jgi:hypothetical protein
VEGIDLYVAIGKQKHGVPESAVAALEGSPPPEDSERARMQQKLEQKLNKMGRRLWSRSSARSKNGENSGASLSAAWKKPALSGS